MAPFGFFSSNDCEQTREYLNSIADEFEVVLKNDLGVPIESSTEDVKTQAMALVAFVFLDRFVAQKVNPNVDLDCEDYINSILPHRLQEWTYIDKSESSDREESLSLTEYGARASMLPGGYKEGLDRVMNFVSERLQDKHDKIPLSKLCSAFRGVHEAESALIRAVREHDRNSYESWITDEVAIDEAKQIGERMAEEIKCHLRERYHIRAHEETLDSYEEAVVGIFYLISLGWAHRIAGEGRAHLGTSAITLRRELEGLPDDDRILVVSEMILNSLAEGEEAIKAIVSWAIAHSRKRSFKWGDDLRGLDYPGEKSLMSVLDDALDFHGV